MFWLHYNPLVKVRLYTVKMNKEKFLLYFKKKEKVSDPENSDVRITNVVKSATNDITKAEITLVEGEIQKSCVVILTNIKKVYLKK